MGNTLSGTVLTKIERLKNVQRDLTREKNAIRRQMQSMTIKIQFQHSRMRMLYANGHCTRVRFTARHPPSNTHDWALHTCAVHRQAPPSNTHDRRGESAR